MAENNIEKYVLYNGLPLVRCKNNVMVYGKMSEKAYAEMILFPETPTKAGDETLSVPTMMMVTIKACKDNEVLRNGEIKNGLAEALEYAYEQIVRFNIRFNKKQ